MLTDNKVVIIAKLSLFMVSYLMRICSVELAGNEVNLCFLSLKDGMFELIECRKRKITLASSTEAYQMRQFHKEFAQLMTDYKIDNVVIKERLTKGKFSGSFGLSQDFALDCDWDQAEQSLPGQSLALAWPSGYQ